MAADLRLVGRVVQRELLVAARHSWLWWVRAGWIGGLALLTVMLLSRLFARQITDPNLIHRVAACQVLFLAVLVAARAGTALVTERRDGTLGLLLLTDLGPWGVVLGKWASCMADVVLLLWASLPVLMLLLAFGGAAPRQVVRLLVDLLILFGCCTAWLLALSAYCRSSAGAVLGGLVSFLALVWWFDLAPNMFFMFFRRSMGLFAFIFNLKNTSGLGSAFLATQTDSFCRAVLPALTALLLFAARLGVVRLQVRDRFCPVSQNASRRLFWAPMHLLDWLSNNPVFKLTCRQTSKQKYLWHFATLAIPCMLFICLGQGVWRSFYQLPAACLLIAYATLVVMLASACTFSNDLHSGMLELLYTSRLTAAEIAHGRLLALLIGLALTSGTALVVIIPLRNTFGITHGDFQFAWLYMLLYAYMLVVIWAVYQSASMICRYSGHVPERMKDSASRPKYMIKALVITMIISGYVLLNVLFPFVLYALFGKYALRFHRSAPAAMTVAWMVGISGSISLCILSSHASLFFRNEWFSMALMLGLAAMCFVPLPLVDDYSVRRLLLLQVYGLRIYQLLSFAAIILLNWLSLLGALLLPTHLARAVRRRHTAC